MLNNTPNTFIELIDKYKVEIPMIQRDYAQGRKDKEYLRKSFVKDLLEAIAFNNHIELDFIYGPIRKEGDSIKFIPLDGQQRLTTLFLLHWYLAKRTGITCDNLYKFTYKVRTSTQDFIDALLNESIDISNNPKSVILDAPWYYSMWNYDPSIQGMLNVLETIHHEYKQYNENQLWSQLTENTPITFNLLNMNKYKLSDELYLKMNARGLPLSDFENFKAWLIGETEVFDVDSEYFSTDHDKHWTTKIDKDWTDLFWKISEGNNDKFDQFLMNFFNNMALLFAKENDTESRVENKKFNESEKFKLLRENIMNGNIVTFNQYKENDCFLKTNLDSVFYVLDNPIIQGGICGFPEKDKKNNIFYEFIKSESSYTDKVRFYAIYKYIWAKKNDIGDYKFEHYCRVMRNLLENSTIDSPATFHRAIKSINELIKQLPDKIDFDILKFLNNGNNISFFNPNQVAEERLKANLILLGNDNSINEDWENAIIIAENHSFFRGQISFLLHNDLESNSLPEYNIMFKNAEMLFDKNGVTAPFSKNKLLLRAFVSRWNDWKQFWWVKFDNNKDTWKSILISEKHKYPLQVILNIPHYELNNTLENFCENESSLSGIQKKVHEDLYKEELLTKIVPGCLLHGWWPTNSLSKYTYILYPYNAKAQKKFYVLANKRNKILHQLLREKIINIDNNNKLDDIPFFCGRSIKFRFAETEYYWDEDDKITCKNKHYHLPDLSENTGDPIIDKIFAQCQLGTE